MSSSSTRRLSGVWGSSSSDVFAIGEQGTILHYNGSDWSPMTSGTTSNLEGVWGASHSDVFAVGWEGTIRHYDGTTWSAMTSGTGNGLSAVWGTSPSDVFAVGWEGTILHYVKPIQAGSLKIYNFNDLNGNGVPDFGESPLAGWELTISGIGKRVTGSDGWIIIDLSTSGMYTVTETLKSGWLTTTPNPQTADLTANNEVTLYFGNVEQVQHPPLVPVVGTWGAVLMGIVFAGSMIWLVAFRARRKAA
jgi:hypothetical protein